MVFCRGWFLFCFLIFAGFYIANAQPGCPAVDAGADVTLNCGTTCTNITATPFETGATTSYTVSSIPFSPPFPFTGGTQIFINMDDIWSNVIALPFPFCFFGNTYTQAIVGVNGVISFNTAEAGQYCGWSLNDPIPTSPPPLSGIYNNSINGAYHDLNPQMALPGGVPNPANINYAVLGTAPCRTLVVNYSTVPHYLSAGALCGGGTLLTTQQIVLYETTNTIEVYLKDKPSCAGWNNGNAVVGLQNANGTQGISPPGRNTGAWSASNEAWQFTPNGASLVSVEWFQGATSIGTTRTVNVCPTANTTYTAQATYTPCGGGAQIVVTDDVTVSLPGPAQCSIDSSHNISCFGLTDGEVFASANSANPGLTYSWNDGDTNIIRTGLAAGTYTLTATDAYSCTVSASVTITQPPVLGANIVSAACYGNGTYDLDANETGGTRPYTYLWDSSPVQTDSILDGISAGTYNVTVTDSRNCTVTDNFTTAAPLVFTQSQTEVLCTGGNTGTATITISSGSVPYSYNWNGNGPTANATLTGISPGTVTVTVADANCSATATFTFADPAPLVINTVSQTNVSCFGGNDGAVTISVSGGTPPGGPYTYSWSTTPAQNTATATGLTTAPVTVTVTDDNNCIATATYTLTEPASMAVSTQPSNATCFSAPNGSIAATVSGGTLPFTYVWSDAASQTTPIAMGLVQGTYTVLITDGSGCTITATDVVSQPADMNITVDPEAVKCVGDANGKIAVAVTGGTQPYTYSATPDGANFIYATNDTIIGLAIGTYTVIVSDSNGCTKTAQAVVPNAAPDNFGINPDSTSCYGSNYNDGTLQVITFTPQNGPYTYSVDNGPGQYSDIFYGLSAGDHILTASSYNNCLTTIPFVILEPLPIIVDVIPDTVNLPLGQGQQVQATYINANGDVTYTWTPELGLSCTDCPNPVVSPFTKQDYVVTVSTVNRSSVCYGSATLHANVTEPLPVFIPNSFSPNGDGNNDVFQIYGQSVKTIDLKIFNRWGEIVYRTDNQFNGWDGSYKGQIQLPSVFTYTAQITFLDDRKHEAKGTVTLLR